MKQNKTHKSDRKMLRYCKVILEKVSFDKGLFRKEYRKMYRWLNLDQSAVLQRYVAYRWGTVVGKDLMY